MDKNIKKFVADITAQCIKAGISFRLENVSNVDADTLPCSGYFDEESIVVATKTKNPIDWVDVLAHESCHFDQWLENTDVWVSDKDSLKLVEDWTQNKKISEARAIKGFKNTIALELDCEKRTVKKLKKYKIKFNEKKYIQKANAYLFSYGYTLKHKKWYAQPYQNMKIVSAMPTSFKSVEEYLNPKQDIVNLFL